MVNKRVGRTTDVVAVPSIDRCTHHRIISAPNPQFASLFVSELRRRRAPAGCFELSLVIAHPSCLNLVHSSGDRGLHAEYFGGKWIFIYFLFWGGNDCKTFLLCDWYGCYAWFVHERSLAQCFCMRNNLWRNAAVWGLRASCWF